MSLYQANIIGADFSMCSHRLREQELWIFFIVSLGVVSVMFSPPIQFLLYLVLKNLIVGLAIFLSDYFESSLILELSESNRNRNDYRWINGWVSRCTLLLRFGC